MKSVRRCTLTISLLVIMAGTSFAGETSSPPCAAPLPGETSSPPCSGQFAADDAGQTSTISGELETVVAEAATYVAESLLTLF